MGLHATLAFVQTRFKATPAVQLHTMPEHRCALMGIMDIAFCPDAIRIMSIDCAQLQAGVSEVAAIMIHSSDLVAF
mgnify:CR=1 FL=1